MRSFSFLSFLSFCCLFCLMMGGRVEGSYHDLPCIRDKLKDVPEISFLMDNIGAAPDIKARLDACDPSAPLTLFIPNNDAVVSAIKRFESPQSVGALDEMQKQFLGALAAYHITTGNSSTASLAKNGVSVLNTTMDIRPKFVALGEGIPQRLLVVAGAGENKTASVLLSMQKNKRYWNGTSKLILDELFKGPNDAMIIKKDIQGKDGYIHVIDKVLLLPKNATEQLKISNLTVFASLITKAGAGDWINNLTAATIFAPTNKALRLLNDLLANKTITNLASNNNGYQSFYQKKVVLAEAEGDIDEEKKAYKHLFDLPKNQLLNLIKAHVFKGVLYSTGFIENSVFTNYNHTDYTFQSLNKTAPGKIVPPKPTKLMSVLSRFLALNREPSDNGNIANAIGNAPIAFANIFTRNGAIHVIDGVLGVNITALPKRKQLNDLTPPSPPTPVVVIPAPNVTQLPTMQSQSVGVACVNGTMMAKLANITIKANITLESPAGPFQLIIHAPIPDCPPSDQLCMVATLSNTCAIPPSPFQGLPTDLVTAKPSEVNAAYANMITFTPRCFNPQTHVCVNNHFLCPTTHPALCGDACYSPNQYRCFAKFSMCPTEAPNLCGEACYHEDKYQCHRGVLKQKEQAQTGGKGRK